MNRLVAERARASCRGGTGSAWRDTERPAVARPVAVLDEWCAAWVLSGTGASANAANTSTATPTAATPGVPADGELRPRTRSRRFIRARLLLRRQGRPAHRRGIGESLTVL